MFVRCNGTRFSLNEDDFFAQGVNCYFLGFCSNSIRQQTLEQARDSGANTIRSWAFLDVAARVPGQPSFQYLEAGDIRQNEGPEGLERLDHLISTAEELGLKLILPFVNYWPDFGGMPMYLGWLGLSNADPADFYRDSRARAAFKTWIERLLTRRNTLTGRAYSEEPAVLAWELANEPRCMAESGRELLLDWMGDISEFVKSLDKNHLLGMGDEGFFNRGGPSHLYNGGYGTDFDATLELSTLDFGTFHMYPEHWGESHKADFPENWIRKHIAAGKKLGKPVLFEEFGISVDGPIAKSEEERQNLYLGWRQEARDNGAAGALLWMLGNSSAETAGFCDKFTVYYPGSGQTIADTHA